MWYHRTTPYIVRIHVIFKHMIYANINSVGSHPKMQPIECVCGVCDIHCTRQQCTISNAQCIIVCMCSSVRSLIARMRVYVQKLKKYAGGTFALLQLQCAQKNSLTARTHSHKHLLLFKCEMNNVWWIRHHCI